MSKLDARGAFALVVIAGALSQVPSVQAALAAVDAPSGAARRPPAASSVYYGAAGVTCRTLRVGILHQESGGNYAVRGRPVASHGGARALGGYQVMPANLPGWSRKVVGRTVSEREYMGSPALQDRIAGAELADMCKAHGPRGAAAEWFSGRPELANDPTPRGGGAASVKAYVDSAMAFARRYG